MSEAGSRNGVLVGAQASGASRSAQAVPPAHEGPDPELRARPTRRRRFTSAYKLTAGARRVLDLLGIPLAAFASEPGPPSQP